MQDIKQNCKGYTELYKTKLDYTGPYKNIQDHRGSYRGIQDFTNPNRAKCHPLCEIPVH